MLENNVDLKERFFKFDFSPTMNNRSKIISYISYIYMIKCMNTHDQTIITFFHEIKIQKQENHIRV